MVVINISVFWLIVSISVIYLLGMLASTYLIFSWLHMNNIESRLNNLEHAKVEGDKK
jgi:hypothetical protein